MLLRTQMLKCRIFLGIGRHWWQTGSAIEFIRAVVPGILLYPLVIHHSYDTEYYYTPWSYTTAMIRNIIIPPGHTPQL